MTGYAVVVRHPPATVTPEELRALLPALRRRGPHGDCVVTEATAGVVSALLETGDRRLAPTWASAGPLVVAGQVRVDARDALVGALRACGANVSIDDADVRLFAQAWLAQWWSRDPAPFAPSEALARYVDVGALPRIDRTSSVDEQLAHLRMRLLDRWLRGHATGTSATR